MEIPTHIGKREDLGGGWGTGYVDDFIYLRETVTQWVEVLSPPAFYLFKEIPRRYRKKTKTLVGIKQEIAICRPEEGVAVFAAGISGVRKLTAKEKERYIKRHVKAARLNRRDTQAEIDKLEKALTIVVNERAVREGAVKDANCTLAEFRRGKTK